MLTSPSENDLKTVLTAEILFGVFGGLFVAYLVYRRFVCRSRKSRDEIELVQSDMLKLNANFVLMWKLLLRPLNPLRIWRGGQAIAVFPLIDTLFFISLLLGTIVSGALFVSNAAKLNQSATFGYSCAFFACLTILVVYRTAVFLLIKGKRSVEESVPVSNVQTIKSPKYKWLTALKFHRSEQFSHFDKDVVNIVQIGVLVVEFVQLLTFPAKDLFNHVYFRAQRAPDDVPLPVQIANVFQLGFLAYDSAYISTLQVQIGFIAALCSAAVAIFFTLLFLCHDWIKERNYHVDRVIGAIRSTVNYISSFLLAVCSIAFIPTIGSFIRVIRCLNDWQTSDDGITSDAERCYEFVVLQPRLYGKVAIIGYVISYLLLSFFLSSAETTYRKGRISFVHHSMPVIKNCSLIIAFVYLVVRGMPTARGIVSSTVLAIMIGYNVYFKSCYVRPINLLRTTLFMCSFFANVIVAVFTNPANTMLMYNIGNDIFFVFLGGWAFICAIMLAVHLYYVFSKSRRIN